MKKLFSGVYFSVKKISDKDINDVIVKLYQVDPMIGGKPYYIGYKIANEFDCHEDTAYDIWDEIRKSGNE